MDKKKLVKILGEFLVGTDNELLNMWDEINNNRFNDELLIEDLDSVDIQCMFETSFVCEHFVDMVKRLYNL